MTTVHRPDDTRIYEKESKSLVEAGWDVTVIASATAPAVGPVRCLTVNPARSRFGRMTRTALSVLRTAWGLRADVYHVHDPELIPAAIALRAAGRIVIYDAHEDLPRQVLGKPWIPRLLRPLAGRLAGLLESAAGHSMSAIVAATPPIRTRFPAGKTVLVRNYPRLAHRTEATPYDERQGIVLYVGGVTLIRGAREMARAVQELADLDCHLLLAGPVASPALKRELTHDARVEVLGWRAHDEVNRLLGLARIGLCVLHPVQSYVESLPTKLFEYMAAGLPVIVSDFPGWKRIVDDAQCGIAVDPLDPSAISRAIRYLLETPAEARAMGRRGRLAAEKSYRWEAEAPVLLELYERLTAPDST